MQATQQDLFDLLDRINVAHRTVAHAPVFTVEESAPIKAAMPGGHTKNLFLIDKHKRLHLISALAETKIDLKAAAARLGAGRFSFGSPDAMWTTLGVRPGAVTPFGLINDRDNAVTFHLDRALLAFDQVWFHPLSNDASTAVAPQDVARFAEAVEHETRIF
jgi:Ala-tRNA(Pro) deacylase